MDICSLFVYNEFMGENRTYIAIDLKSFYASVECVERKMDPLMTNLVVADNSRTDKTICLAVTPSLKSFGVPGRPRLFEVKQIIKEANALRLAKYRREIGNPRAEFQGMSVDAKELEENLGLGIDFLVAEPRMAFYMDYSTRIYDIYLKYVAPEDMHIYSVDEVFMDVTGYLDLYKMTAHELTIKIIRNVLAETGITATAGIGTNMYLAKIAMDIEAKHREPDEDGVRIAELDEMSYRRSLWAHKPITDFWRVGKGIAKKLKAHGMYTMGDVARCSLGDEKDFLNEELLYKLFGVNAELLIDHAWGWEPCPISEIKAYRPESNSLSEGQVLQEPYTYEKARLIVKEMTDHLSLNLVRKKLVCDQLVLTVGYDIESVGDVASEEVTLDYYGRAVPKHAHGTHNLGQKTSSGALMMEGMLEIFDRTVNPALRVRRINVVANHIEPLAVAEATLVAEGEQLDLFSAIKTEAEKAEEEVKEKTMEEEKAIQETLLNIKKKFGKNAVVKGMNLEEGATAISRNKQIGGHKA